MTTELHAAWCYDCDECGKENFVRAVSGDAYEAVMMLDEAEQESLDVLQAEEADTENPLSTENEKYTRLLYRDIVIAPKYVTCGHCGHKQAAEAPKLTEPNEDEA